MLLPITRPEGARLMTLPWSVIGGPPTDMVLPSIAIVPETRGVNVSPAAVRRPFGLPVAIGIVELPIMTAEAPAAMLIGVPNIMIAGEPGLIV